MYVTKECIVIRSSHLMRNVLYVLRCFVRCKVSAVYVILNTILRHNIAILKHRPSRWLKKMCLDCHKFERNKKATITMLCRCIWVPFVTRLNSRQSCSIDTDKPSVKKVRGKQTYRHAHRSVAHFRYTR